MTKKEDVKNRELKCIKCKEYYKNINDVQYIIVYGCCTFCLENKEE